MKTKFKMKRQELSSHFNSFLLILNIILDSLFYSNVPRSSQKFYIVLWSSVLLRRWYSKFVDDEDNGDDDDDHRKSQEQ